MQPPNSELRPPDSAVAVSVIKVQALITALAAGIAFGMVGKSAALAAAYGGLIALLPTGYFALRVFSRRALSAPRDVVGVFYQAEIGKFALTAVLFFLGIAVFAQQFLPMMLSYMACLLAYFIVLARAG
jgi:ATP synthase protein I